MKMEMPDTVRVGDLDVEVVTDKNGQKWPATYLKPRDKTETYHHSRIVEALKAENETHKKAYWDLLESWSDLRVKYSIAVDELAELKAKLEKAKWQPIESAPRDGTPVDLWMAATNEYDAYLIPNCSYDVDDELWFEGELVEVDGTPTHWMPLPDAPEQR